MAGKDTGWRTIKGAHVLIDKNGTISKGPKKMVGKTPYELAHSKLADKDTNKNVVFKTEKKGPLVPGRPPKEKEVVYTTESGKSSTSKKSGTTSKKVASANKSSSKSVEYTKSNPTGLSREDRKKAVATQQKKLGKLSDYALIAMRTKNGNLLKAMTPGTKKYADLHIQQLAVLKECDTRTHNRYTSIQAENRAKSTTSKKAKSSAPKAIPAGPNRADKPKARVISPLNRADASYYRQIASKSVTSYPGKNVKSDSRRSRAMSNRTKG